MGTPLHTDCIGIVACAQHPLIDGVLPGEEYIARLDEVACIVKSIIPTPDGLAETDIHIFNVGSLHDGDVIPLANAGQAYLSNEHGLHSSGNNLIQEIMPAGIYNGADEMTFLREIHKLSNTGRLKDYPPIARFIVVANASQIPRLKLHAGDLPVEFRSIETEVDSHQGIVEKILYFYTLLFDRTWQNSWALSPVGHLLRTIRRASQRQKTIH